MQNALIVVDVQNDFCPGGALAVTDGDKIIPTINSLVARRFSTWDVYFTKDYHPADSDHFREWPPHCVQGTPGANFHPDLRFPTRPGNIFAKGVTKEDPGYSGLAARQTDVASPIGQLTLHDHLIHRMTKKVWICGLALDYCVKATALDVARAGFETIVLIDACKGVGITPKDIPNALEEMSAAGVGIDTAARLLRPVRL